MILPKNRMNQPFLFWLIGEFFSSEAQIQEAYQPINDREFYAWLGMISVAVLIYAAVFRFFVS